VIQEWKKLISEGLSRLEERAIAELKLLCVDFEVTKVEVELWIELKSKEKTDVTARKKMTLVVEKDEDSD